MRLLIDNALSPAVAEALRAAGHDAVHLRELGRQDAPDEVVLSLADQDDRVLVSADTDSGDLLAGSGASRPSIVLFRGDLSRQPAPQTAMLLAELPAIAPDLDRGCIAVFEPHRIRLRALPLGRAE